MRRSEFILGALAAARPLRSASDWRDSIAFAVPADDTPRSALAVRRRWKDGRCESAVINRGNRPARIREVVLFSFEHGYAPDTALYGESFQMLSQTGGTLGQPADLGYSERRHYRIPQPEPAAALSGVVTLTPAGGETDLFAFTSCRRFHGRFLLLPGRLQVVLETEGLTLAPGESWPLEEFLHLRGSDRSRLLARLAEHINRNHPPLRLPASPPTGWCSWYCFGPRVTATQVLANLDAIASAIPGLRYIQIDDGYQSAMGDWLDTGAAFGGDVLAVIRKIRERGFEPALWVAPFIAEAGSRLFRAHPDWFMKDSAGAPMSSDRVTFGGWRRGPWFALDGTHPEVQRHLETLFRTMRNEWGVTYFKMDANFWGAMHGARLHDGAATRIEAYRRGMEAIVRGAGDSFLLGCNHPIWPSFGLLHGSRSSDDISRRWDLFDRVARQNLNRNWQNGRLWWNDPDAVVLDGTLPENEFRFHATAAYASGGMILSGDDLTRIPPDRLAMLRKLLPARGVAAEFTDASLRIGYMQFPDALHIAVLNPTPSPQRLRVPLPRAGTITELWTGTALGRRERAIETELPPRCGAVFVCA
ncbi:MAG TPA: alpha-galactosidase [Solibacterales bacterium]|nr:alpha-galactosidase [Bryobacterales bacterium]